MTDQAEFDAGYRQAVADVLVWLRVKSEYDQAYVRVVTAVEDQFEEDARG